MYLIKLKVERLLSLCCHILNLSSVVTQVGAGDSEMSPVTRWLRLRPSARCQGGSSPLSSGGRDQALTTPRTAHSHRTTAGICLEFVIRAADAHFCLLFI